MFLQYPLGYTPIAVAHGRNSPSQWAAYQRRGGIIITLQAPTHTHHRSPYLTRSCVLNCRAKFQRCDSSPLEQRDERTWPLSIFPDPIFKVIPPIVDRPCCVTPHFDLSLDMHSYIPQLVGNSQLCAFKFMAIPSRRARKPRINDFHWVVYIYSTGLSSEI
jgi:hypothetical protein